MVTIAADRDGGSYSLSYTLTNPSASGTLSASCDATWVTDLGEPSDGTVGFTVQPNPGTLRQTTITLSYSWDGGTTSDSVTVVQDHQGDTDPGGDSNNWTHYGTGDFEYLLFFIGSDPGLDLYQNSDNPNRFKITHWLYDVDFLFTWNQATNVITVDEGQYTGTDYSYWGDLYVCDFLEDYDYGGLAYYGATTGYYKDGIFYFAMEYYCSYGVFCIGYETFSLDGSSYNMTVNDLQGSYNALELSAFTGYLYVAPWVIEASDNSSKGNIMLTAYDDFECEVSPIYGDFDATTGIITIAPGQYYADFYYEVNYQMVFETYYGDDAYFLLLNNGDIWGALWGEIPGTYMYYNNEEYGWWDGYEFNYAGKDIVMPYSLSTGSTSSIRLGEEHSAGNVIPRSADLRSNRIKFQRVAFNKPTND